MQQSTGHYGSHPQYGYGAAAAHLATPGYTFRFPVLGGTVMPPPGFQFPGAGFQAASGPCPGCPASQDYQDYLEGAPHSSHSKKDPHASVAGSEPEGDLIIDKTEELIPIDMDGGGSSNCKIIEVVAPSPETTPVKKSKTKQKPIDQVMKLAAAKVSAARVDNILGAISSSNGGGGDTTPSTTPVKKMHKTKKKKKSKDSASDALSESEDAKAAEKAKAEQRAKVKEEGKQVAMRMDYPIIKMLRAELGLPF